MAKQVGKKFTWVIKDFSSLQSEMYYSASVLIGNCKWYLSADPKENNGRSLCLGLHVDDYESLPSGWRRYVKLRLSIVKQNLEDPAVLKEGHFCFDQNNLGWGFSYMLPLTKLLNEKEGFLVNGELMIGAEVEVLEVIGTFDGSEESEDSYESLCEMNLDDDPKPCDLLNQTQHVKESIEVNGFQVLPSQAKSVRLIFERHPNIAAEFRAKNQHLRKACMDFLLSIIETLCQSLEELSNEDIVEADIALTYLKDAGFKVEWLERKLDQVKEKKEKEQFSLARLHEMEDSLLKLKQKCSEVDALVEKEEAELSATRTPLSFDDDV